MQANKPNNETKKISCTNGLQPLVRNQYFYGKLLTVKDFENEQNYHVRKQRLINRYIHGEGVVCGLKVEPVKGSNTEIVITSGIALDCCGREIIIPEDEKRTIPTDKTSWVKIHYDECGEELVAATTEANSCEEKCCYSRVKEYYKIEIVTDKPEDVCSGINWDCNADISVNVQQECLEKNESPLILAKITVKNGVIEVDNLMSMGENEPFEKKLVYSNPKLYELMKCGGEVQEQKDFITIESLSWKHIQKNVLEHNILKITFSENIKLVDTNQGLNNEFSLFPEVFKLEVLTSAQNILLTQYIIKGKVAIKGNILIFNFRDENMDVFLDSQKSIYQFRVSLNCNFIRGKDNDKSIYCGEYSFTIPEAQVGGMPETITELEPKGKMQDSCGKFESWFYVIPRLINELPDLRINGVYISNNIIVMNISNIGSGDIKEKEVLVQMIIGSKTIKLNPVETEKKITLEANKEIGMSFKLTNRDKEYLNLHGGIFEINPQADDYSRIEESNYDNNKFIYSPNA